jgi:hypothetical protein
MDESTIQELIDVVRALCEKVAAIDAEVDRLGEAKIYDRLDGIESEFGSMVGGLNDIIDGRRKREYSSSFRTSHPEFGKYEDIGKRMGVDIYDTAANRAYEFDSMETPDEAGRDGAIAEMLKELSEKFDDVVEALSKNKPVTEVSVEVEKEESPAMGEPMEPGVDPQIIEIARGFRNRSKAS